MESRSSLFSMGPVSFAFVPVPASNGSMRFVSHTILRAWVRYARECEERDIAAESLHVWLGEAEEFDPSIERKN